MRVTIVGPNLRDQSKGTFHVHAEGCADIARNARRDPAYADGWTVEVASQDDVVLEVYGPDAGDFDFNPDDADDRAFYRSDFHFLPCASLPVEGTTQG
jgi:hypothetical protein